MRRRARGDAGFVGLPHYIKSYMGEYYWRSLSYEYRQEWEYAANSFSRQWNLVILSFMEVFVEEGPRIKLLPMFLIVVFAVAFNRFIGTKKD